MLVTSLPLQSLAADPQGNYKYNYDDLTKDKAKIINENKLEVKPVKADSTADVIKNPDQPAIYTLRTDYKVQRGEKYQVDYQPYIASVGEAATKAEKDKVKKTIDLPALAGYDEPQDNFTINYETVKKAADGKGQIGDKTNGIRYQANEDFRYKAKANKIKIKHVFQDLEDFTKYTNPNGTVGEEGELITTQNGNTGSTMEVSPLEEKDRRGFVPEAPYITMQVPEDATDFVLEYRYNRAHYNVDFDTMGGTPLPTRTYYYDQEILKIEKENIPTKIGCDFLGWKPSHDLKDKAGKDYPKGQIINKADGKPAFDLDVHLKMPALLLGKDEKSRERLKFTAVWKDKEKADYAIQFWVEKSDHADNASIMDKYEYMGTRVHKDAKTGSTPDLDKEPVKGLKFPDLDQARLNKIWNNATFNRGRNKLLDKFFVYNKDLTDEQNKDAKTKVTKTVSATGKTVYNIYYDRQVYDLYFTKSNQLPEENTFYPQIWGYDEKKGEAVMKGGPGNLYHYKARFNEMMYKWPNDAKQTKGFTPGYQSFGWGPNYAVPNWPLHLDTPPYRLNAEEFLDMDNYTKWGGYTKKIDKGNGTTMDLDGFDFTTLSFGIKQDKPSIPHHMDFWMDGFKDGETIIRYDLVRTKADTANLGYGHRYPRVQGFTPYGYKPNDPQSGWPVIEEGSEKNGRVTSDDIDDLNDEREEINPNNSGTYYNNNGIKLPIGQLDFIPAFFSDTDEFGDIKEGGQEFKVNGYLRYKYTRNKYPLRFNYDPTKIKDDSEFNRTNQLDTFYEFPLKVLSPDVIDDNTKREDKEYFKEDPANLIDNPYLLYLLGLYDLLQVDKDKLKTLDANKQKQYYEGQLGKEDYDKILLKVKAKVKVIDKITGEKSEVEIETYKVKRPEGLSDQMVFKGWALDPAGTKLIWENKDETMPTHPVNLYAKWGEPDYKWKVTFDPDGGRLKSIKEENLTEKRKTIQEGDIGQEEVNTYAKKEENDGDKQVFTVIQRQRLVKPVEPVRKGYDFMGWEVIRYKKDEKTGDYTEEIDDSYREKYGVPELYTFGNDVVGPITLKAIWNPNQRVDVKVYHHFLDKDCKVDGEPLIETLENKRTGYYTATTGDQQGQKWILAPHEELMNSKDEKIKKEYKEYNKIHGFNNTYFQNQRIEPEKIKDPDSGEMIANPNYKGNEFHFFYRPFRQREYKVNYIDERFKGNESAEGAAIIKQELVTNGNRHYDARNYRPIPGWVLAKGEKAQQQLFFDLNEDTNEFLGINGTGGDQIFFYYKDVRVIEVPKDDPVPDGYVRVTFKADKGGSFGKDAQGNEIKELHYDVIKGLKSDLLPVPGDPIEESKKEEGKYYITPETGKKFVKWDNKALLNDNTIINTNYEFTAYFEWSGLSAKGLVRTESYNDPNDKWTNDFAPTIEDLKKQLVWKEKDEVKKLPAGTIIEFFYEAGNKITTDDQVYNLVKEIGKADKEELVRTVNITAKVTFKDGKDPQELTIPIKVYKNVYEALNKEGDKPLFLKEAEGKEAKDGGLSDVTGDYVMVTIKASKDFNAKDDKIYYVNKNAWVEIPEVKTEGSSTFVNWTADKAAQNEGQAENGIFDFGKRHKFTEDTVISPKDAKDVVEQTDPKKKPDVPDTFVKVIVMTTDKATDETKFEKTFWVNPTKEVNLGVANPTGKSDQEVDIPKLGKKKVNYIFKEWQKVQTGEADDKLKDVTPAVKIDLAKNKFTDKVTVIEAAYYERFAATPIVKPIKTDELHTPEGKEITDKDLIDKITPPENKEIESITVVERPDPSKPGKQEAKVTIKYKDGTTQGTNDKPVVIPVEVHKNIIPEAPGGKKPADALENYVKVIFKAGEGGTLSGDLVYYVSPEVEVDMTESAAKVTKTPNVGYFVNGENWTNKDEKALKGTFTAPETEFVFKFDKSKDIVEKTNDPNQVIPKGYVKVTFKTDGNGKVAGTDEKIYYVNPNAGITLKVLGEDETATEKQLAVPTPTANTNYVFREWQENIDENTPITSEKVHVAIFQLGQVTLTYEKGGDDVTGDAPDKATAKYGEIVGLAGPGNLKKPNASFAGWKLDEDEKIYQPGEQVKLEKARTATAQWETNSHTVTFDTKGGSKVESQKVEHNQTAIKPEAPTLDGKVFMGWKEQGKENEEAYFNFDTQITEDKTLIAIWQDPVQRINDGDTVEDQFIKVTFNEGKHGKLKLDDAEQTSPVIYKVAKGLSFDQAKDKGMTVPKIVPNKYYKAKADKEGWDKALKLEKQNVEFTAQYEPEADVIPIEPGTSDDDIKKEKPDGMVLVEFKVTDDDKFYLAGTEKYYVKKDVEVRILTPVVLEKTMDAVFEGWKDVTIVDEPLDSNDIDDPKAKIFQWVKGMFKEDTVITDDSLEDLNLVITIPNAGKQMVYIKELSGNKGKLEVISGSKRTIYENTTYKRRRKTFDVFKLSEPLKSGDIIRYWAEDGSRKSIPKKEIIH